MSYVEDYMDVHSGVEVSERDNIELIAYSDYIVRLCTHDIAGPHLPKKQSFVDP